MAQRRVQKRSSYGGHSRKKTQAQGVGGYWGVRFLRRQGDSQKGPIMIFKKSHSKEKSPSLAERIKQAQHKRRIEGEHSRPFSKFDMAAITDRLWRKR